MFVGHYGVSYGGKALDQTIPLWILFLAVQCLDVLWGVFVLLGIERVRIVPGITATNPLDLYFMPYTHSLLGAVLWSVVAGLTYHLWRGRAAGRRPGVTVGAAVLSHWILDLLVHRPDLPLIGDRFKVGFGLWNVPAVALLLEMAFLFGGLLLYLRVTRGAARGGTASFLVFGAALVLVQAVVFFGAPPPSPAAAAITALGAYAVFAAVAAWLERKRVPRVTAPTPSPTPTG